MKRVLLLLLVVGLCACQDKGAQAPVSGGSGNHRPRKDAGMERDAGSADASIQPGPTLTFTAPKAATNPNLDEVMVDHSVKVRCNVEPRSERDMVDSRSVEISLESPTEPSNRVKPPVDTIEGSQTEREAAFDLSGFPNGTLTFHCAAKELAEPYLASEATLLTLLDLGPKIEVFSPKDKDIKSLNSPVVFQFKVEPEPLTETDNEAKVKQVKLVVSGIPIDVVESSDTPGQYQTSVDFSDTALFKVPPTSSELVFSATNERTPNAATRSVKYDISIDGVGPAINVLSPPYGSIQHGEVTLQLDVTDTSGVRDGSVRAVINDESHTIDSWDVMGSKYQQTFDTRTFGLEVTQLTINFSATDIAGNLSTVSHVLQLDNVPPILSLDPPPIRMRKKDGDKYYCSTAFDPVGDATNDRETVVDAVLPRVLVEDLTNAAPGSNISYYAGVAKDKVVLYAQKDDAIPLLMDTNGDGECDEINLKELPELQRPTLLNLRAIGPRGGSFYFKDVDFGGCKGDPNVTEPPLGLCSEHVQMTRIVTGQGVDRPDAVYAFNPGSENTAACVGATWSLKPIVGEGWTCLAARAEDTIGNVGISAPLRVCLKHDVDAPDCDPNTAPSCRKNDCQITTEQQYPANVIWLTE